MDSIYIILIISVMGPVIGSFIGIMRKPSHSFMHNMLAFAAGVMVSISLLNLIPKSIEISSISLASIGVLIGALVIYAVNRAIPYLTPELHKKTACNNLEKTSIYLLVGIFLHNFPEGMAIAIGTVASFKVTLSIALAIAIHNIPEGICTSAPYYFCTGKKLKSFLLSSSTAIPIVIGFIFGQVIFQRISLQIVGIVIAAVAGMMIYIAADELIPTSCNKQDKAGNRNTIFSLIAGVMFVIVLGSI